MTIQEITPNEFTVTTKSGQVATIEVIHGIPCCDTCTEQWALVGFHRELCRHEEAVYRTALGHAA